MLPREEGVEARRSAAHPSAAGAARASMRASARWLRLTAGVPGRRSRLRAARVELGAAVARYLPDELAPGFLADSLASRRSAQVLLAETDARPHPVPYPTGAGSRAARYGNGSPHRPGPHDLRDLGQRAVQVWPRQRAARRLRAADAQLGAWATGLAEVPVPELRGARQLADQAQQAAQAADAERRAAAGEADRAARLALRLAAEATVDFLGLVGWALARAAAAVGSALARAWARVALAAAATGAWCAGVLGRTAGGIDGFVAQRRRRREARAGRRGSIAAEAGRTAPEDAGRRGAMEGSGGGTGGWRGDPGRDRPAGEQRDALDPDDWWAPPPTPEGGQPGPEYRGRHAAPTGPFDPAGRAGDAADGSAAEWWRRSDREPVSVAAGDGGQGSNGTAIGAAQVWPPDPRRAPARDAADPGAAWAAVAAVEEPAWPPARGPGAATPPPANGLLAALWRVAARVRLFGRRLARRLAPVVSAAAAPPDRARRGSFALFRPIALACVFALVLGGFAALPTGIVMAGSVRAAGKGLPDLADLKPLPQAERTEVYDVNNHRIAVLKSDQDRIVVPLSAVPRLVQFAVLAAEDARFYEHHGVDQRSIFRALLTDIFRGAREQGGSTITQQLVRNAYPNLRERSVVRKVKEAALAAELERRIGKSQILEQYLNRVYFGSGYYGVQAASYGYFNRPVRSLTLAQAATLAGVIRSPESGNPRQNPDEARRLRDSVLDRMVQLGMVRPDQAAKARIEPLRVAKRREFTTKYPWFMDGVKRQLLADPRLGRTEAERSRRLFQGGLRVYTTLNPAVQAAAERAAARWRPASGPDVAIVSMLPKTGEVRAVVGGRNWSKDQFNLALQGQRQAGSSFKPFVLAAAMANGISPDSVWESSGWPRREVCGVPWAVNNYEGSGSGLMPVRVATWHSVNAVYGRLMEQLCPAKVVEMAHDKLGISLLKNQERVPSIALGSANVVPIDMVGAYATFANMGVYHKPRFVNRVLYHGKEVFNDSNEAGEQRIQPALAWEVNDVLKGVISNGTAVAAQIGRPAAGKTGTTQDYRDAWFVGYTPNLATAVWMGYPQRELPMRNIEGVGRVTGGSFPARIWRDFTSEVLANTPGEDWQRPPDQLSFTVLPPPPPSTTNPPFPSFTLPPGFPGGPPITGPGHGGGGGGPGPPVPPTTLGGGPP
ncbi:MAG TPA: transglycosylase domain-containing protein [Actinomycetes bacterium]